MGIGPGGLAERCLQVALKLILRLSLISIAAMLRSRMALSAFTTYSTCRSSMK